MMSHEQLMMKCPAIFAESPVADVSKRYTFIPTIKLVEDFQKLGWYAVERSRQTKSKDSFHSKHMVIMRSHDLPAIDGLFPEILMINSHNKTTAFKFVIGLFRLVCENGLIVGKSFDQVRMKHIGYDFERLKELTETMAKHVPQVIQSIHTFEQIMMTPNQQAEFAMRALVARFPEYRFPESKAINREAVRKAINIDEILTPLRRDDEGEDLWHVFNRIQEKVVKGGWKRIGQTDLVSKSVRSVGAIKLEVDLNQTMWNMAAEYAAMAV